MAGETQYRRLKLFLVPLNAGLTAVAASEVFQPMVRAWAGIFASAGIALYALINDSPTPPKAKPK